MCSIPWEGAHGGNTSLGAGVICSVAVGVRVRVRVRVRVTRGSFAQ